MLKSILNKIAKKLLNATEIKPVADQESAITKDCKVVNTLTVKEAQQYKMYKGGCIYRCIDNQYNLASRIEKYNPLLHDDLIVVGHTFVGDTFVLQVEDNKTVTPLEDRNIEAIKIANAKKKEQERNNVSDKFNAMSWAEIQRFNPELISAYMQELRDRCFDHDFCIDDMEEMLGDYRTELLQTYLLSLEIQGGTYHPEESNLDSLSREQIIKAIKEQSFENYKSALERKGIQDVGPSVKQLNLLAKNGIDITKIITKKKAKQLIDDILSHQDNSVTDKQIETIDKLVTRIGASAKDYMPKDRQQATETIKELIEQSNEMFGEEPASDKQKELYENLLKRNNMRFTPKRKTFVESATKSSIGAQITALSEKYNKDHPNASEGQINYICSMIDTINFGKAFDKQIRYDKQEMLNTVTREGATRKISELKKEVLFIKTRITSPSLTKENILALSDNTVTEMLNQMQLENKTRDLTRDAEDSSVKII